MANLYLITKIIILTIHQNIQTMAGFHKLLEFLRNEGFRTDEQDGLITFKIQGKNYLAFKNGESPFLQIISIYDVEGNSRSKLLETCNTMNQDRFILKYTINNGSDALWCSYEFKPNSSTTTEDFMSVFSMLEKSVNDFFEKLQ